MSSDTTPDVSKPGGVGEGRLGEIEAAVNAIAEKCHRYTWPSAQIFDLINGDIPDLLAEVRNLQDQVRRLTERAEGAQKDITTLKEWVGLLAADFGSKDHGVFIALAEGYRTVVGVFAPAGNLSRPQVVPLKVETPREAAEQAAASDKDKFIAHLEQASETVRTWPAWKQGVLGGKVSEQAAASDAGGGNSSHGGSDGR